MESNLSANEESVACNSSGNPIVCNYEVNHQLTSHKTYDLLLFLTLLSSNDLCSGFRFLFFPSTVLSLFIIGNKLSYYSGSVPSVSLVVNHQMATTKIIKTASISAYLRDKFGRYEDFTLPSW